MGWTTPYDKMERGEGFDMFCPFRKKRMVLLDGLIDGERNKDDEEIDIWSADEGSGADNYTKPTPTNTDIQDEPDIEDMAAEEWTHLETKSLKHEAYVIVDAQSGGSASQHKSSVL